MYGILKNAKFATLGDMSKAWNMAHTIRKKGGQLRGPTNSRLDRRYEPQTEHYFNVKA